MNKTVFNFEEKHHVLVVDGLEYEVPQRTAALEQKIREHDEKLSTMTEYDGNMDMLSILFGREQAARMFPDKENTNLDKLARCTMCALSLLMSDFNAMQAEDAENRAKLIQPVIEQISEVGKAAAVLNGKQKPKKAARKKL